VGRYDDYPDGIPPDYIPAPKEHEVKEQSFKDKVRDSSLIPNEMKEILCSQVSVNLFLEKSCIKSKGRFYTASLGWESWAIRDDNLRLLEVLSGAALAVTAFATVATATPAVLAVTLVLGCIALADRLRKKGKFLEEDDYKIIMTLKAGGPLSADDLAPCLGGLHIFGIDVWSVDDTLVALNKLKAARVGDGSVEPFLVEASDGLWSVNGL
jgi:hypothetical protein